MRHILATLLVLGAMGLGSSSAFAAKAPETVCWFDSGYLYATGLPTTYPYAVTPDPYPTGTTQWSTAGTLALYVPWLEQAFVWVRGHGGSLIKAGPQLNDFKVIAMCEAT